MGLFPEWTWIVGLMIGASIGSFLNVVIYRMPRAMSLKDPKHSICPNCRTTLGLADLVPLFSYLFLRGKCRHCSVKVSSRYFWVEVITGCLFAGIWYRFLIEGSDPARAIGFSLFAACLVAAIYTDLAFYIIPDEINAAMLLIGLGTNVGLIIQHDPYAYMWGLPSSVTGALLGTVVLWAIAFLGRLATGRDAMGHGDIKMVRGIGAVLLPIPTGVSFMMAVALGVVIGISVHMLPRMLAKKQEVDDSQDDLASEEEEGYEPESVGSLLKCGLGYLLAIDALGLLIPKLYEKWFGENPFAHESVEEEDFQVGVSTIPFGPYLALGALVVALLYHECITFVTNYWNKMTAI
jgi:leader peptidase (prepilin peptidase)/N-methyltransferase